MNWNEMMKKELNRVGTGARMTKVPPNRRPSAVSLMELERSIASQIRENEAMCTRSMSYASSASIR